MEYWEIVTAMDQENDLADPESGRVFLMTVTAAGYHHIAGMPIDDAVARAVKEDAWHLDGPLGVEWRTNIHALRSLLLRLKGRRGRKAEIDPDHADRILAAYVSRLRIVVSVTDKPISRKTFVGCRVCIRTADCNERAGVRPAEGRPPGELASVAATLDCFWQQTLCSLVCPDLTPVCDKCRLPLGLTPKGRRPRAGMCKRCAFKAWQARQPKAALRERWRRNKRAERERTKRTPTGKG